MSGRREIGLRLALLDQEILDRDDLPIGRVDDIELDLGDRDAAPEVSRLLVGSRALGPRIGGLLGRWISASAAKMADQDDASAAAGFGPELVGEIEPMIKLDAGFEDLPELAGLERWLRRRFVERLPGTGDASE